MSQMVFVKRSLKNPDEFHELQAKGHLRASFTPVTGSVAALGFAPTSRMAMLSSTSLMCDPLDPNCTLGELVTIIGKASDVPAMARVGFAVVRAQNGRRADWAATLVERARGVGEEQYVAAAHIMGTGPFNGLVEVMGPRHEGVLRTLLDLTDIDGVVDAEFGLGAEEHTRGFGTQAHEG